MVKTARQRARAEITEEILEAARAQLAEGGAQQLSLRAVAREVGMVSSAVYRYFPSRDELLTRLIVEAYDSLARAVMDAESAAPRRRFRRRWRAACTAARQWALDSPHDYALIYGSPVPGYAAPDATIEPATRVSLVFLNIVRDTGEAGLLAPPALTPSGRRRLPAELRAQLQRVSEQLAPGLQPDVLARVLMAWTQLFGMISFELFGHLVGSADPAEPFFEHAVDQLADFVGIPAATSRRPRGG